MKRFLTQGLNILSIGLVVGLLYVCSLNGFPDGGRSVSSLEFADKLNEPTFPDFAIDETSRKLALNEPVVSSEEKVEEAEEEKSRERGSALFTTTEEQDGQRVRAKPTEEKNEAAKKKKDMKRNRKRKKKNNKNKRRKKKKKITLETLTEVNATSTQLERSSTTKGKSKGSSEESEEGTSKKSSKGSTKGTTGKSSTGSSTGKSAGKGKGSDLLKCIPLYPTPAPTKGKSGKGSAGDSDGKGSKTSSAKGSTETDGGEESTNKGKTPRTRAQRDEKRRLGRSNARTRNGILSREANAKGSKGTSKEGTTSPTTIQGGEKNGKGKGSDPTEKRSKGKGSDGDGKGSKGKGSTQAPVSQYIQMFSMISSQHSLN